MEDVKTKLLLLYIEKTISHIEIMTRNLASCTKRFKEVAERL